MVLGVWLRVDGPRAIRGLGDARALLCHEAHYSCRLPCFVERF